MGGCERECLAVSARSCIGQEGKSETPLGDLTSSLLTQTRLELG